VSTEARLREEICRWGQSLFARGLTAGASGNLSARLEDGTILATPTNSCLGFLDPATLSRLDAEGRPVSGAAPTKEVPLHLAFYRSRSAAKAVVHLHSTYATMLSCLQTGDPDNVLAPITPYAVMRVGRVARVPYVQPGSPELGRLVAEKASAHAAVLLANHGPVASAANFETAVFAAEELEETAKLLILSRGLPVQILSDAEIATLNGAFPT
jgi:ribulose-5-phosphate 4-epimerase/fuculose-1-phosphate aldolase